MPRSQANALPSLLLSMRDPWTAPQPTQASAHRSLLKKALSLRRPLDNCSESLNTSTVPPILNYRPWAPIARYRQRRQAAPSGLELCPPMSCPSLDKDIRPLGDGPQVGLVSPQPSFTPHCIIVVVAQHYYGEVTGGRLFESYLDSALHASPNPGMPRE